MLDVPGGYPQTLEEEEWFAVACLKSSPGVILFVLVSNCSWLNCLVFPSVLGLLLCAPGTFESGSERAVFA